MLTDYAELFQTDPLQFLALHVITPDLLHDDPELLEILVKRVLFEDLGDYVITNQAWEFFHSDEYQEYLDNHFSLNERANVSERLEILFQPLISRLESFEYLRDFLFQLASTLLEENPQHQFSEEFPVTLLGIQNYVHLMSLGIYEETGNGHGLTEWLEDPQAIVPASLVNDLYKFAISDSGKFQLSDLSAKPILDSLEKKDSTHTESLNRLLKSNDIIPGKSNVAALLDNLLFSIQSIKPPELHYELAASPTQEGVILYASRTGELAPQDGEFFARRYSHSKKKQKSAHLIKGKDYEFTSWFLEDKQSGTLYFQYAIDVEGAGPDQLRIDVNDQSSADFHKVYAVQCDENVKVLIRYESEGQTHKEIYFFCAN